VEPEQERHLSHMALKLIIGKKKGPFTSKDKKLHITYDEWSDHLDVFHDNNLVFRQEMGKVITCDKGEIWTRKLEEEYSKRS